MIHAEDKRRVGKTTLSYFDGHSEALQIDPKAITLEMFNDSAPN